MASIGLGIGANTAIFTLLNAVMLKTLPVKDPARVVIFSWLAKNGSDAPKKALGMSERIDSTGNAVDARGSAFPYAAYKEIGDRSETLSGVFAYYGVDRVNVFADGVAQLANGEAVSGNYYRVLGVPSVIGRTFDAEDDREGATPVAVISYRFWRSRFALDPGVIGKKIVINGAPFTIVGVEQERFLGLENGATREVLIPLHQVLQVVPDLISNVASPFTTDDFWWVRIGGRIAPGIAEDRARSELDVIIHQSFLSVARTLSVEMTTGGERDNPLRELFRKPLLILMAFVCAVLLIACANVAGILLARAADRENETALRVALGASWFRLVQQSLTESLLLSGLGGTLGLLIAYPASLAIAASYEWVLDLRPDGRVLAFTATAALMTGVLSGLGPALAAMRVDQYRSLHPGHRGSWLATLLVVGQFALALVILVGAGLYLRTLYNLHRQELGINAQNLLVFHIEPSLLGYTNDATLELCQQILERLERTPGVSSATVSWYIPLAPSGALTVAINVDGMPTAKSALDLLRRNVAYNSVGPGYFQTLGTPIVLGRGIEARDRAGAPRVAVIDEALAKDYFPGVLPIGRSIHFHRKDYEVIGVVRDSRYSSIRKPAKPTLFTAYLQQPENNSLGFELRTVGSPKAIAGYIHNAVGQIDPRLPVLDVRTEEELIDQALQQERLFAHISGAFGVLVVVLASTGIYGVRAHAVARRTREFGLRMAVGASPRSIMILVMRESAWIATGGIAFGLAATFATTRLVQSMLFGVTARDWPTLGGAVGVLLIVTGLAAFFPARRAARLDPSDALRQN